jgi:hypothetical protein
MCGLERFIGFVKAGKLCEEIFDEELDAVAEAQTGGVNVVVGARPHFASQALVNRAARRSRPCGIDPSRKNRSSPSPGRKRKTGPLCSSQLHKGPALYCLAAIPNGRKGRFRSLGEVSL